MSEKKFTIPNVLSCIRLAMVAVFVYAFFKVSHIAAGVVALLAALTDVLDGWIARRYGMITNLGQILDPLADKLLQAAVCICIGHAYDLHLIPLLFLGKEFCMMLGGFFLLRAGKVIPPSRWYGKLGTVCFFIGTLSVLFFCKPAPTGLNLTVVFLLGGAALIMLAAFCGYIKVYFQLNGSSAEPAKQPE